MTALLPLMFAATSSAAATVDLPPTTDRLAAFALAAGFTNPEGVVLLLGVEHRTTYSTSDSVLFRDLYLQYGAEMLITGMFRPAAHVEWLPIKILRLRLQYDFWIWPGFALGRGHGLAFPNKDSPFFPEELERRKGEEEFGIGHRLMLAPTLQLKVWRVILLNTFELGGWYVHGEEAFWRDPYYDNLIKRGAPDLVLRNFALLLFEIWADTGDQRILAGGVYEVVRTMTAEITRQRLGVGMIVSPFDELIGLNRPTMFFLVGRNLEDRNREDEFWINFAIRVDLDLFNERR